MRLNQYIFLIIFSLLLGNRLNAQAPILTTISPSEVSIGGLLTIDGTNLTNVNLVKISNKNALIISQSSAKLVVMPMPGSSSGIVTLCTNNDTVYSNSTVSIVLKPAPNLQQGEKIRDTTKNVQGYSVALSSDGNTLVTTGDGVLKVYYRNGNVWSLNGDSVTNVNSWNSSVAINADGTTICLGVAEDSSNFGAIYTFVKGISGWVQQGAKIICNDAVGSPRLGTSISISANGNTIISGGPSDNNDTGAVWVFKRTNGIWAQYGSKLVGTSSSSSPPGQGESVSISADGEKLVFSAPYYDWTTRAIWIFKFVNSNWIQEAGPFLVGSGSGIMKSNVSISADGKTVVVGEPSLWTWYGPPPVYISSNSGGCYIYYCDSIIGWVKQSQTLFGTIGESWAPPNKIASQSCSVAISANGDRVVLGSTSTSSNEGAVWVFDRINGSWEQIGRNLFHNNSSASVATGFIGYSCSISGDGSTIASGDFWDNNLMGATWIFAYDTFPTFYAQNNGVFNNLNNWNNDSNGIGNNPANLTDYANFIIAYGKNITINSPTQFGSYNSKLIIKNNGRLDINDSFLLVNGTIIQLDSGGILNVNHNFQVLDLLFNGGQLILAQGSTLVIKGVAATRSGFITGSSTSNLFIDNFAELKFNASQKGVTNVLKNVRIGLGGTISCLSILNELEIEPMGGISFDSNGAKYIVTNDSLILKSTNNGTAYIGNLINGYIFGKITVENYIPSGRRAFRFLSHPFNLEPVKLNQLMDDVHITGANGAAAGFDSTFLNNPSAFSFSESAFNGTTNSGWTAFTNASISGNDINAYTPIRVLYRGPRAQPNLLDGTNPVPLAGTIDWSGYINQGTIYVPITKAAGANGGWNLLPNPYPSNYDLGITSSNDRNGISSFSVWVPGNGTRGAYSTHSFGSTYVLQSGAAFFVQTGSAGNFIFNESQKTASAATANLFKTTPFNENAIQIDVLSDSIYWDKLEIRNRAFGTHEMDLEDAPKMDNPDLNIFTYNSSNQKIAIDNLNINHGTVIPFGFNVSSDYHFTLSFSNVNMKEYQIQLADHYLNKTIPISQNTKYNFSTNADSKSKGLNRFSLIFNKATGIEEENTNLFVVYPNPVMNELFIQPNGLMNQETVQYNLYNALGSIIQSGVVELSGGKNNTINTAHLSNGVYFIELVTRNSGSQIVKIIK
jgi:hypothetical protein